MIRSLQRQLWCGLIATVIVCAGGVLWPRAAAAEEELSATQRAFKAAEDLFQAGQMTEALTALQNFEKTFGYSTLIPQVISYEGWCEFNLGQHKEAAANFERLIKNYPNSPIVPGAVLKLAESYRELKDIPKALATYHQFEKDYPDHELLPQAYLGEAWTLFKQWQAGNTKEKRNDPKLLEPAQQLVEGIARKYDNVIPVKLDALFLLGQIYNERGDFEKSRAVYDQIKSLRNNPRAAEALFLAGEAMYDAGRAMQDANRPAEALKRFKDAIDYYQRVPSKASLLRTVQRQIDELSARIPRELNNRAALQRGIQSLQQLAQQISSQPDLRPLALFRTANAYQFIGYADESVVVYRHFLRLYPDDKLAPQAQFGLSQALTQAGRSAEAKVELDKFKQKYPELKNMGEYVDFLVPKNEFDSGQYPPALDGFKKFVSQTKDAELKQTGQFYIGACYYALQRFAEARDAFAQFLKDYPAGALAPDALFRLGRANFEISQRTDDPKVKQASLMEAVRCFEEIRSKKLKPDLLPDVTFQLGYLYSFLADFDKSNLEKGVAAFQDYAAKWPDQPLTCEALFQSGELLLKMSKIDEAVTALKKVVAQFPDTNYGPSAAFEIGRAYAIAKRHDEMIAALHAYVEKYPTHARVNDALFAIAADLEGRNKIPEALAAYRQLVAAAANAAELNDNFLNSAIAAEVKIVTILDGQDKFAEAVADCEQFIKQFQKSPAAIRSIVAQLASLYRNAKKIAEGKAELTKLAHDYAAVDDIRIATNTALLELILSQKDRQAAYAQALKLLADPQHDKLPGPSFLAIGNAFLMNNRYPEARENFAKALAQSADDPRVTCPALVGVSQAYLGLKLLDDAETAATRMIKDKECATLTSTAGAYPAAADASLVLAKVYEAKGRTKDALALYTAVMQQAKGDAAADAALSAGNFFLLQQKDPKTALPYFLRVTFMAGGSLAEEAAFRIGQCQELIFTALPATTDKEKATRAAAYHAAVNSYKSYLSRYPDGKFATDAKTQISNLESHPPAS